MAGLACQHGKESRKRLSKKASHQPSHKFRNQPGYCSQGSDMQMHSLAAASGPISTHKFKLRPQPGRPLLLPKHRLPLQNLVITRFGRTNATQGEEQQPVAVTARQSWVSGAGGSPDAGVAGVPEPRSFLRFLQELDSPFLEPWVRAFILGVGTAVLLETGHVATQFLGLLASAGPAQIASVLPDMSNVFAPLVLADNMAAIVSVLLRSLLACHPPQGTMCQADQNTTQPALPAVCCLAG